MALGETKYIAVCPVEPVAQTCPVELEIIVYELPQPLTWQDFQTDVLPTLMIVMMTAWGWKKLRQQVWPK